MFGSLNFAYGSGSLAYTVNGNYNRAIGYDALYANVDGSDSIAPWVFQPAWRFPAVVVTSISVTWVPSPNLTRSGLVQSNKARLSSGSAGKQSPTAHR